MRIYGKKKWHNNNTVSTNKIFRYTMTEKHQKHRTSLQSSSIPEKKRLEGKYEKTILPKIICQKSFAENHFAVNHGPKNKKHRARTTRWNREKLRKKKPAFQFFLIKNQ